MVSIKPLSLSALLLLHQPLLSGARGLVLGGSTTSFILPHHRSATTTPATAHHRHMSTSTSLSGAASSGDATSRRGSTSGKTGIVWYKNCDLRLLDHKPLTTAHAENQQVYHVFCQDPRLYDSVSPSTSTAIGGMEKKTGYHRARFVMESALDLKQRLKSRGSDLVIAWGRPEDVLPRIREATGATAVYCHR